MPKDQLARSVALRTLLPSLAAGVVAPPALAAGETREPGTNYAVTYNGPVGGDFTLGGGGGAATVPQYNPRVVSLKPGGVAAAAGVRIGDEVALVRRPSGTFVQESLFRMAGNVDREVKGSVGAAGSVIFRACGMVQPREQAPDFRLPAADGSEVSLADLRAGGRRVVLFFRPGARFMGGDVTELKLFARAEAALGELGATVVAVATDSAEIQGRQASKLGIKFPMLSDADGAVASSYGALVDLAGMTPSGTTDRKTYVIGADGRVEAVFPVVGWEVQPAAVATHLAAVASALGGEPDKVEFTALPKQKTVGEVIALSQQR